MLSVRKLEGSTFVSMLCNFHERITAVCGYSTESMLFVDTFQNLTIRIAHIKIKIRMGSAILIQAYKLEVTRMSLCSIICMIFSQ
jgi:hypothetical protein